jgi:hypothetical protein
VIIGLHVRVVSGSGNRSNAYRGEGGGGSMRCHDMYYILSYVSTR